MKKVLFFISSILMIGGTLLTSCQKPDPDDKQDAKPKLSITADQEFAQDNKAELTLTLSAAAKTDVKVTLANEQPQAGKERLTVDYTKNVTIKAGETTAKVTVTADVFGLEAGDYQAGIKVDSVEGAEMPTNPTVYINYTYIYMPEVNLYADTAFAGDKTAKLQIVLANPTEVDVVVTLADAAGSEAEMNYDKSVTVPAGQKEVEITVTVNVPENLAAGVYPGKIKIESAENAIIGKVSEVTINLSYPFSVDIQIDGVFDDWNTPNLQVWTLPEGQVLYDRIKVIKFAANAKYVYMYAEFEDNFSWGVSSNIYIDADGNPETGGYIQVAHNLTYDMPPYALEEMGLEWYLEHWIHADATSLYNDMFSWNATYKYNATTKQNVFGNLTPYNGGSFDGNTLYCIGVCDSNNNAKWEIQFNRTFFGMTGNSAAFAFKLYEGDNFTGLLPQGKATDLNDYKSRELVPMAKLTLPAYQE